MNQPKNPPNTTPDLHADPVAMPEDAVFEFPGQESSAIDAAAAVAYTACF
jgi:hypothetical protein